jgi:hypothetical protein
MTLGEILPVLDDGTIKIKDGNGYGVFNKKRMIPEEMKSREVERVTYGMFYISECIQIFLKEVENEDIEVANERVSREL